MRRAAFKASQHAATASEVRRDRHLRPVRRRGHRVARLGAMKEELFQKYLKMSDAEKADARLGLMNDYVLLDPRVRVA